MAEPRWSSRKFLTMVSVVILSTGLLIAGYVSEQTYIILFGMSVGAYFTANVMEHLKK